MLIAVTCAMIAQFMMVKSIWGFKVRAVGENSSAAQHSGIGVNNTILSVAVASGALAGMAGVSEVAGLKGDVSRFVPQCVVKALQEKFKSN